MSIAVRPTLSSFAFVVALGACGAPATYSPDQATQNAMQPGWTGSTFVVGSTSSVAGTAEATYDQQKWGIGRHR